MKKYAITYVTKEDVEELGFDATSITEAQMEDMAQACGQSYLNGNASFWEDVESFCIKVLKLKQN